ncbi:hypothetical protein [uncultured Microbacterium sp.]|uniref:hypothetical protein n=1 Tax=uncultured Microbacterium sp. TaxID=191216 RepID=UPI0028D0331B|nr:hypothetical protein [uncultured Microbacterium sp.]
MLLLEQPTDLWGVAIPTWLGAVGSILASIVAVIAIFVSRSAQGGVKNIAEGLNRDATTPIENTDAQGVKRYDLQPWGVIAGDGMKLAAFRNTSGQRATVTRIDTVGGLDVTLRKPLPYEVPANGGFEVVVHRILGGGAVRGITLDWVSEDGRPSSRTYYI